MRNYTQEERQKAVDLYISSGFSPTTVKRKLGYPCKATLLSWYHDYLRRGYVRGPGIWPPRFSEGQKKTAVEYYLSAGKSLSQTVRDLGYPSRTLLSRWVDELAPSARMPGLPRKDAASAKHREALCGPFAPPAADALAYIRDIFGIAPYNQGGQPLCKEAQNMADDTNTDGLQDKAESLKKNVEELEAKVQYYKMEAAIWQAARDLLKKDLGIDLKRLINREKTILADALKTIFPLNNLLEYLGLARSSYYYQKKIQSAPDKYAYLRSLVREEFEAERGARGHRTVWARLRRREEPVIVSEKVVLRIMKEEGLFVSYSNKKKRSWSSYAGEIGKSPANLVERNFHADAPNTLWLTDITQFSCSGFKCYLSALIDCFDGKVIAHKTSLHPDAELANSMLDDALAALGEGEHPICHSDRGVHYRWPGWIERCKSAGITRSMSKKGCSPDNAACEGFFGRLKNEFFYDKDWEGVTFEEFSRLLEDYIEFYNEKRIKKSLGWMSPNEYRRSLGLVS